MPDIKQYACFTAEQQQFYNNLNAPNRLYVDLRGKGYSRSSAYKACGYTTGYPAQAAAKLENKNKGLAELIDVLLKNRQADLANPESAVNQTLNALTAQNNDSRILQAVESGDGETARRIKFYTDIMNGVTKSVKVRRKYDADGNLVEKVVEQVSDINLRVQARKELDRLLGLNEVLDMGALQCGDITINIVDARKKEEAEDPRNKIDISPDNVEIIDGEECVVVEEDGDSNG